MNSINYAEITCPHCGNKITNLTQDFDDTDIDIINLDRPVSPQIADIFNGDQWECAVCKGIFEIVCYLPEEVQMETIARYPCDIQIIDSYSKVPDSI